MKRGPILATDERECWGVIRLRVTLEDCWLEAPGLVIVIVRVVCRLEVLSGVLGGLLTECSYLVHLSKQPSSLPVTHWKGEVQVVAQVCLRTRGRRGKVGGV